LLDLAAPLKEQLPSEQRNSLHLERSMAIVVTTAEEESYPNNGDDDRILLHIQAATTTTNNGDEKGSSSAPHYSSGILHPGSLKEHGDYCLVYISVVSTVANEASASLHRWQVQKVEFLQMELPETAGRL
jgi:hypothetical protein